MICKECGSKMLLDDQDYNFKGNYDNYYRCESCDMGCVVSIRFGKVFMESWFSENGKEYKIYHNLRGTSL